LHEPFSERISGSLLVRSGYPAARGCRGRSIGVYVEEPDEQGEGGMARISINGKAHEVPEGQRLLAVLGEIGVKVPNLCFHHALTPSAACRLCVVEIKQTGKPPRARLACASRVKPDMAITTESALIHQLRSTAIGNLLKMAPHADAVHRIGQEFGIATGERPDGCIRCRLCVRACSEIIGAGALKMESRGPLKYVAPSERGTCIGCLTCVNICPTDAIGFDDKEGVRTISIRDEVIGRHALERCEVCGRLFATKKFLEHVKVSDREHPEEKGAQVHCPTCAKVYYRKQLQIVSPHLVK
jgi:ferredoxin